MTTTMHTPMHTPWGPPQDIEELAEGVWRVSTASHGGLKLSRERWNALPACVRDAMLTRHLRRGGLRGSPIVRTLLGLGNDRERELALKMAGYFDRYAPGAAPPAGCRSGAALPRHRLLGRLRDRPLRGASTPGRRRTPSPATGTNGGTTGGWRPSSAAGRSRSAGRKGTGHDHDDQARPRSLPSRPT